MHTTPVRQAVLVAAVALLAFALVLVGCGSGGGGDAQPAAAKEEKPFEGRQERDTAELEEFIDKAQEIYLTRESSIPKDKEEAELNAAQASAFRWANADYRSGEYAKAQEGYEGIIEEYSAHYGANVNLTLALLQQEKNDDALVQALVCVGLYPTDPGPLLNVQTAAVASGFTADAALEEAAYYLLNRIKSGRELAEGLENQRLYNTLWDAIELSLHDVAQGKAKDGAEKYRDLLAQLDELLAGDLADDEDVHALRAYLVAVGTQLEIADEAAAEEEAAAKKDDEKTADDAKKKDDEKAKAEEASVDLDAVQAHAGLPYVVADDEVCTIVFTGYHMASDDPVAEFEFVNNSDEVLRFSAAYDVTGNGKKIENLSAAWPSLKPGEQDSAWGCFFATEDDKTVSVLEGDLTSLSCVVKVSKKTGESGNAGVYPFKWEADASKVAKKMDKKIVDNENGVTVHVTSVLPAGDGIVAVEYSGSYEGDGDALVGGSGWKANGADVELLGVGSPLGTGSAGHNYLLFRAKGANDLREGEIKSLTGTLVISDADGKELVNKPVEL